MPTFSDFQQARISDLQIEPIILDEPISIDQLPTPALTIDLDIFDANIAKMQSHLNAAGLGLRCHTKMHKSPIIARKQIAAGAIGVCCATISEAEVMLAGGITKILITSPVVTDDKILRLLAMCQKSSEVEIVVDYIQGADRISELAGEMKLNIGVLVDLDPGMGRTGIEPGQKALELVRHIGEACPNLTFNGLQMYIGNCMHVQGFEKRRDKYLHLISKGIETKELLESNGIQVPVFSGGGTGTYDIDAELGALTDLQAGSYAFMDVEYRDIGGQGTETFVDFEPSLFSLVTAISKPQERLITVDAGIKCLATDTGYPEFRDVEGATYHFGGDEHGIIQLNNSSRQINLGDRLSVITPHCDPTVNLYDYYYPYRQGMVTEIWPISARGRSQ
ncbi:MAG: DSD1 family PLP-dependent enzyme [Pseudomonadales bacterium]|jgi:3-hydroxy-D-aspartate aldolase|tara:strand:+ start:1104 stop:2279 length:1176 start_codon:yes stop_codon:yes gene_type:complete